MPGVVPWAFCDGFGVATGTWHHSHSADVIQWAIGMESTGPVEIIHPSSGQFPTLTCRYSNGTLLHMVDHWGIVKSAYKAVPESARLAGNFGGRFVGERGWITSMTTGGPIEAGPFAILDQWNRSQREVVIGASNHHAKWFECIRTRSSPSAHEEIGHRSASLGHLITIAFQLRRSLKWDPAKEEFNRPIVCARAPCASRGAYSVRRVGKSKEAGNQWRGFFWRVGALAISRPQNHSPGSLRWKANRPGSRSGHGIGKPIGRRPAKMLIW